MDLLEEIQNAAVDADSDLGTLLRRCKLLAARLGSKPLEDWLIWESNGYPDDVTVPEYRIWPLSIKGHFAGPFGSGLRNVPIPLANVPEGGRKNYERYECRQSIASIEAAVASTQGGMLRVGTGDLALILGTKVYQHQNCIQTWAEFSSAIMVELLNAVRNRVLDFALAVGKEERASGENLVNESIAIESSRVTQIFNTTIYGGSAQLVGTATQSAIVTIPAKDFARLERVLRDNGVTGGDVAELKVATEAETQLDRNKGFGPQVSSWIAQMMRKAADGSWDASVAAAGSLLAQALTKYYGL